MKISKIARVTGLLLVTGFFYSCGSSKINIDSLIQESQYDEALSEIEMRLQEDPAQPRLYIQKAEVNVLMAREQEPEIREDYYTNAAAAFDSAVVYEATSKQLSTIDSLKQQYWKYEHNAGLRAFENEELENQFALAVAHFKNAVIIRDDARSSYKNLSIAQFRNGDIDAAIENMNAAKNLSDSDEVPTEIFENLGYLYLEKGEPDQAIYYYELANKNIEENINLAYGLINAYIAAGDSESAAEILEGLVENFPQNANLRNVYGTQLYEITSGILDDLKEAYINNDTSLVEQIKFEAEGMGEQAEQQLIEAFKRDTSSTDYIKSLSVFYNNLSAKYFSVYEVAFTSDKKALKEKALTLTDFAIEYYTKLTEIDPQNEQYQSKLNILKNLKQNRSGSQSD